MTDFIAVDGESFTQDTDHRYVLLAAADAEHNSKYAFDKQGLSTVRCFEFLLGLPKGPTKVAFGWNYDVNMILRDLDNESLVRLWKLGWVVYKGYRIEWIPNKIFTLKSNSRQVRIYDVFGFFQSSFVKALEAWEFGPQDSIEAMKAQRSAFDAEMKQAVIAYCLEECRDLCRLCNSLALALSSVELSVSSWIGAGAIAASLLAKEGISDHHVLDSMFPKQLQEPIACSYFGGRVELYQQGIYPHLWDYDISSAYPSEALKLPSLTNGKWHKVESYDPDLPYAIWHCRWSIPKGEPVMPFPYRKAGAIYYPREGQGWYHGVEVRAAMELYGHHRPADQESLFAEPQSESPIEVVTGWHFIPVTDTKPFDFIPRVYNERAKLKRQGHAGEKVLKLGLNSLYGKLAQGVGYKGEPPKFQSFFWAGMITAGCRARVLELVAMNRHALVMVATDGVFFSEPVEAPVKDGLGGLELTVLDDVFIAQPGIYQATIDGKTFGRSRGFFTREIDFEDLRRGYLQHGPNYIGRFESERFVGLGTIMITGRKDVWRTWAKTERKLSLYPSRKFIVPNSFKGGVVIHHPPEKAADTMSEAYTPKKSLGEMTSEELEEQVLHLQGHEQPLKEY